MNRTTARAATITQAPINPTASEAASDPAGPVFEIDDVSKRYSSVTALDRVSLSVRPGEFVTLLGPSGSGKTTLLKIIAGATRPTSGRLLLGGRDITHEPPGTRGIGMVFQNFALMPHMSVFENIAFPLHIRKVPKDEIRKRVTEALELIQLPAVMDRKPRELSGGQQQRVAIARCLVYRPPIILMDEPLGALDKKLREQMQYEIKRLHDDLGLTIIFVTHDQEEALTMSDRICLMDGGRICEMGAPADIYSAPKTAFAADFFGAINVFPGRRSAGQDGDDIIRNDDLGAIRIAGSLAPFKDSAGLHWMVRPERIRLLEERQTEDNAFDAIVVDRILFGGLTRLIVRVGSATLTLAQLTGSSAFVGKGDRIRIGWPADATVPLTSD